MSGRKYAARHKLMNARTILAVAVVMGGVMLYQASNWWERAYATYSWSETSPDGCLRVDTYNAFRVVPSAFHRIPHPDPTIRLGRGMSWDATIFKRAYEVSTGAFLGESIVYDPSVSDNFMDWGDATKPGRRVVLANGFAMVDTDRCADKTTLKKLQAYYDAEWKRIYSVEAGLVGDKH